MSKHLKVIVCSFNEQRIIRINSLYPDHNQDISSFFEHSQMWKQLIDMELEQEAGINLDILIVVNGTDNGFFDTYNGMETKNGKIIVAHRDNIGGSFGGYSFAYKNYIYDTYLFTEDDLFVFGEEYYRKILDKYNILKSGFMALIGVHDEGKYPTHAHGAVGLASREVLNCIVDENGELPYYHGEWIRENVIKFGEIAFTNHIFNKHYKIDHFGSKMWDKQNLIMPYFDIKKCI